MVRLRLLLTLVALLPGVAQAQPADPYAPAPVTPAPVAPAPVTPAAPAPVTPQDPYAGAPANAPLPTAQDPVLAERVAASLVARAQELLDQRVFLDAKQLAVEALVQSPRGSSADHARAIIRAVNQELGIAEEPARPEPIKPIKPIKPIEDVDTSPIQDPAQPTAPVAPPSDTGRRSGRVAAGVHGALYGGLLGTTIGAFFDDDPARGGVPVGIAIGVLGGLALPKLADKAGLTESQVRVVGSATVWGGALGGLFADIAKTEGTSAREVLVTASITSTVAGLAGVAYARSHELTRGDVALVDTLAGLGAAGGLTLGMVMQPVESEGYSLNAVFGITAGVIVGVVAAPRTNTTPRRMLRVAGIAAIGGAAPFLLYAGIRDGSSTADERITGALSTGGLVLGTLLGLHWTRDLDAGLDTPDGKPRKDRDDAPVAVVGRSSTGRWALGGLGLAALSPALAPQHGMALQLVGATF